MHDEPDTASPNPGSIRSLDVVRAELEIQQEDVARRSESVDSKSGLVLGASGVVVALHSDNPAILDACAAGFASIAAALAVWSLAPQIIRAVRPADVRQRYLNLPADHTRLALLDTRIALHEAHEHRLHQKWQKLRLAMGSFFLSTALSAASVVLMVVR